MSHTITWKYEIRGRGSIKVRVPDLSVETIEKETDLILQNQGDRLIDGLNDDWDCEDSEYEVDGKCLVYTFDQETGKGKFELSE